MKTKIKKIFNAVFETNENIVFKFSLSSLVTAIIFTLLVLSSPKNSPQSIMFTYIATFFFSIWMIITRGVDSLQSFGMALLRLIVFFMIFIYSLNYLLTLKAENITDSIGYIILLSFLLFCCCFYFISKLSDIYNFVKTVFNRIKSHVFKNMNPTTSKLNQFIANITVFLVTIGGFTIAIKTIIDTMLQIHSYFK